jgi:hypothetical protein
MERPADFYDDPDEQMLDKVCMDQEMDSSAFNYHLFPQKEAVLEARQILIETDQRNGNNAFSVLKHKIGRILISGLNAFAPGIDNDFARRYPSSPYRITSLNPRLGPGKNFLDR